MRQVLIIGGAGYIGLPLSANLLDRGYAVRALDNFIYGHNHCVAHLLKRQNYEFSYGDLCDPTILNKALEGITDVIILAGLVGDPITKKFPEASEKINDIGIQHTIDALNGRGLKNVIFVSTCSNYGLIKDDELADENFELNPLSLYAKSKVAAEKHILSAPETKDYAATVLRFATAFGLSSRMRFDLTVSEFTRDLAMGRELLVFDAETWRPYCHVQDFSRLIEMVLSAPVDKVAFETFNAGGDINNFTKQGIVDCILQQIPDGKVKYKDHGSDPRNYRVNFEKVRTTLGFEPEYTVQDGVAELVAAIKAHVFDGVEHNPDFYGNYELKYKT